MDTLHEQSQTFLGAEVSGGESPAGRATKRGTGKSPVTSLSPSQTGERRPTDATVTALR